MLMQHVQQRHRLERHLTRISHFDLFCLLQMHLVWQQVHRDVQRKQVVHWLMTGHRCLSSLQRVSLALKEAAEWQCLSLGRMRTQEEDSERLPQTSPQSMLGAPQRTRAFLLRSTKDGSSSAAHLHTSSSPFLQKCSQKQTKMMPSTCLRSFPSARSHRRFRFLPQNTTCCSSFAPSPRLLGRQCLHAVPRVSICAAPQTSTQSLLPAAPSLLLSRLRCLLRLAHSDRR